jgi:uncharacterized protein YegP (UPF0339 family)
MAGKFEVKKSAAGWKFNLKSGNGEVILTSEVYSSESSCKAGIESVKKAAPAANTEDQTVDGFAEAKNPKFEIYLDKAKAFRFRLKAKNGENIGASESYSTKAGCKNGIESVIKNAPDAKVVEV